MNDEYDIDTKSATECNDPLYKLHKQLCNKSKYDIRLVGMVFNLEKHPINGYNFHIRFDKPIGPIAGVSIMYPNNVYENIGYNPSVMELVLINDKGKFLFDTGYVEYDSLRFGTLEELIVEIVRISKLNQNIDKKNV